MRSIHDILGHALSRLPPTFTLMSGSSLDAKRDGRCPQWLTGAAGRSSKPELSRLFQRPVAIKMAVEVHKAVMETSPNSYNLSRPVTLKPTLLVE
jgi:hypothetical protein